MGDDEDLLQDEDTDEEEGREADEDLQAEECDDAEAEVDGKNSQGKDYPEGDDAGDEGDLENGDLEDDETVLDQMGYALY